MMDRIEDETVRYLFFLQVRSDAGPVLPFPDEDEGDEEDGNGRAAAEPAIDAAEQQRQAAKNSVVDFTRNIQRKKEKELEQLHFGGDDSTGPKQVLSGQKVGRNDPCPCGSGKKYKKCHGG